MKHHTPKHRKWPLLKNTKKRKAKLNYYRRLLREQTSGIPSGWNSP